MQKQQGIILLAFCIGFVTMTFGQINNYSIKKRLGFFGGITQYDILTNNFTTKSGIGWQVGMSSIVEIPQNWYNVSYNIRVSENKLGIAARSGLLNSNETFVDYNIFTAQIDLLIHIKLIRKFLTVDVGPMSQYNGNMAIKDKTYGNYIITSYENLLAKDLKNITNFNVYGAIGASMRIGFFSLKAEYVYGFTNMLNKLNKEHLDLTGNNRKIKGNQSMWAFTAMISF